MSDFPHAQGQEECALTSAHNKLNARLIACPDKANDKWTYLYIITREIQFSPI
jgi:hypothetical protein